MTRIIAIIPARLESSRFPKKMLVQINGVPLIKHVYNRVKQIKAFEEVYVATDHASIAQLFHDTDAKVILTDASCPNGTARIVQAISKIDATFDFVVNVQGDEALIDESHLGPLLKTLQSDTGIQLASLYTKNKSEIDFANPNCVKVVLDNNSDALYFSRSPIPFRRNIDFDFFLQHVGVYAFSANALSAIKEMATSELEQKEKLEQLTWLSNGWKIKMVETTGELRGIDTKEDLEWVNEYLSEINRD